MEPLGIMMAKSKEVKGQRRDSRRKVSQRK
jgi:hypothetical protein